MTDSTGAPLRDATGKAGASGAARIGVILIGHGDSASHLLDAAKAVVGNGSLDDVVALDAGEGDTVEFTAKVDAVLERLDQGKGVVVLGDLFGSSPCNCGRRELVAKSSGVLVTGLNLAMLCKLSTSDRVGADVTELAEGLAETGRRSIRVAVAGPADAAASGLNGAGR